METVLNFRKGIFICCSALIILFFVSSCATKATFQNSSVVPAAEGYVKVKADKNDNYLVKVEVQNLAASTRLSPPRNTYVVWMMSNDNTTRNIGQIISSSRGLSNSLQGSLESVTTLKPVKIFITAEDDPSTEYPDSQTVLSTNFF